MNNKLTIIKILIAAVLGCLVVILLLFKLATRAPDEITSEDHVKSQVTKILSPLLHKDYFRVEVSHNRKDYKLERQSVAILIDEAKALSRDTLEQVDALLRVAIGHEVARGDSLRITLVPFNTQSQGFSLTNEQKLYALEAAILLMLLVLSALYFQRKKAVVQEYTPAELPLRKAASLSEQVIAEPSKAAAILRVWLNEKENVHG